MQRRIEQIIKDANIKKIDFAKRLNVSSAFVSQMCSGVARPSDRTISDICREFNVNRIWLETGDGEPYTRLTVEEELAVIFGGILAGDPSTKSRLIKAFARLPDDAYPLIADLVERMAADLKAQEDKKEAE